MSGSLFTPKAAFQETVTTPEATISVPPKVDRVAVVFQRIAQYAVVLLMFLLPIFFTPGLKASLGFDKVILSLVFGLAIVVLVSLMVLRCRQATTVFPLALVVFWGFAVFAFIASFFTGDVLDSVRGRVFETQTAGFLAVLALMMTVPLVLQKSKTMSLKALLFFGSGAALVILYNLIRLLITPDSFTLGSFPAVTVSPIGGFNDLAIFSALIIIIGLITLLQLPLKARLQSVIAVMIIAATALLAIVNFFHLWIVVGFFALLVLVYLLSRDTLFNEGSKSVISPVMIGVTLLVCLVSVLFIVAGDYVGAKINNVTGVSYVEVRPSMSATIDIARAVYQDNLLLGDGPNRFADSWRLHKDRSINETVFWNTDFASGFGFSPTIFITMGILGGLVLVIFQALYVYTGYRMLLKSNSSDPFWYYFGVATFVGSVFLWGMSYLYVPGATILLLTALFTGLSFVAYQALLPESTIKFSLVNSRRRGFFLMAVTIIVVSISAGALFTIGKQYVAQSYFSEAQAVTTIEEFEAITQSAWSLYPDDEFVGILAQLKLNQLGEMMALTEPSQEDQERFLATAEQSIVLAQTAIAQDPTNPNAYATLAVIYNTLDQAGLEGAGARADEAMAEAIKRDPLNPSYALVAANKALLAEDFVKAREEAMKSFELRRNSPPALFLLAQIDIQEGDVESAIAMTRQITTLEPNNPTRYYQLGILLASNNDVEGAITAYQAAIAKDPNFANARYLLALSYLKTGRVDESLAELRIVQQANQDNTELQDLINQIETNGAAAISELGLGEQVSEGGPKQTEGDAVVTDGQTDTDLVSPVNTPAATTNESESAGNFVTVPTETSPHTEETQ